MDNLIIVSIVLLAIFLPLMFLLKDRTWSYVKVFTILASLLYLWVDCLFISDISKQRNIAFLGVLTIIVLCSLWRRKYNK